MKNIIKKHITKYLLRYFDNGPDSYYYVRDHFKFYLFLRWLSEFVKSEEDTKYVMISIARSLYHERLNLPFTDIFVVENVICICTRRPGLWIGKAGCVMDEIIRQLNFNLKGEITHNFRIRLLETTKGAIADIYNYTHWEFNNY